MQARREFIYYKLNEQMSYT